MTQEEKQEIINAVLQQIKAQSSDITELPTATSLDNVKSLPAMQGSSLVSAPLSLLIQGISFKNEAIYDLGIVANFNAASTKAAERTITEDARVHIILWRSADGNRGDSSTIIQSRWGSYYVIQVMMFVGQKHSCRYRLITTGGNYSVGEWNDLIIPSLVYYDPGTHRVMYNGFLSGDDNKKTLFEIPVADDEELGLIRIGGSFYMGENDELNIRTGKGLMLDESGNIQVKVNTAHGLGFYRDNSLAVKVGKGIGYEEDTGGITVLFDKGLAFDEDSKLRVNAGEGITFDGNGGIALNIGTDTEKYKGLIFNSGSRTIGVYAGKGLTFDNNSLVLNLADNGGLVINNDAQLTIDVPKLKEMLGLN